MDNFRNLYIEYAQLEMREAELEAEQLRMRYELTQIKDRKALIMDIVGVIAVEKTREG